ncbi:MAG: DNA (cytosine-5-)-methyltransferase [Actinomycetota bacterium]|nr:DNA (cytosine-5-)-methyltransferase [Actinomycetota bacterium]
MRVVGLFAGIGGLEFGLDLAGHETRLLCEIDEGARSILARRYPDLPIEGDVRELPSLPDTDLVAAGFPCQDLSMAGRKTGIRGDNSGLVEHLFRLLDGRSGSGPTWLLLENVPYMLHLDRGKAMHFLTTSLEARGFSWAYRVVDARAFGIPQRRLRVVLLASRTEDPRDVLLSENYGQPPVDDSLRTVDEDRSYGFYWTEGKRGLGWTRDAVPTIKGGSGLGIASPPAVWVPRTGEIGTPDIRDVERLQGFPPDWTAPAVDVPGAKKGARWLLVGNAVCTPVSRWVGEKLQESGEYDGSTTGVLRGRWPMAAWGSGGKSYGVDLSTWPRRREGKTLEDFLNYPLKPLSRRATAGFLKRARESETIRYSKEFLHAVELHLERSASLSVR